MKGKEGKVENEIKGVIEGEEKRKGKRRKGKQ